MAKYRIMTLQKQTKRNYFNEDAGQRVCAGDN